MSMVPLLFRDWWDEDDLARPSRLLDQQFGLGLRRDDLLNSLSSIPRRSRLSNYIRPWDTSSALTRQDSGSTITQDKDKFQATSHSSKETLDTMVYKENCGHKLGTEVKKNTEEKIVTGVKKTTAESCNSTQKTAYDHKDSHDTKIYNEYFESKLGGDVKENTKEKFVEIKKHTEKSCGNPKNMTHNHKDTLDTRIYNESFGSKSDSKVKNSTEENCDASQKMSHNHKDTLDTKMYNEYFGSKSDSEVKKSTKENYDKSQKMSHNHKDTLDTTMYKEYFGSELGSNVKNSTQEKLVEIKKCTEKKLGNDVKKNTKENCDNSQTIHSHKDNLDTRMYSEYFGSKLDTEVKKNTKQNLGNNVVEITEGNYANSQKMTHNHRDNLDTRMCSEYHGSQLDSGFNKNTQEKIIEVKKYTEQNPQKIIHNQCDNIDSRICTDYLGSKLDSKIKTSAEEKIIEVKTYTDAKSGDKVIEITKENYENPQKVIHNREDNLDSSHSIYNDAFGSKLDSQVKKYTKEKLGNGVVEVTVENYDNRQKIVHNQNNLDSRMSNDYLGSKLDGQVKTNAEEKIIEVKKYTEGKSGNKLIEITEENYENPKKMISNRQESLDSNVSIYNDSFGSNSNSKVKKYTKEQLGNGVLEVTVENYDNRQKVIRNQNDNLDSRICKDNLGSNLDSQVRTSAEEKIIEVKKYTEGKSGNNVIEITEENYENPKKIIRNRQESLDSNVSIYNDSFGSNSNSEVKKYTKEQLGNGVLEVTVENYDNRQKVIRNQNDNVDSRTCNDNLGSKLDSKVRTSAEEKIIEVKKFTEGKSGNKIIEITEENYENPQKMIHNRQDNLDSNISLYNDSFGSNSNSEVKKYTKEKLGNGVLEVTMKNYDNRQIVQNQNGNIDSRICNNYLASKLDGEVKKNTAEKVIEVKYTEKKIGNNFMEVTGEHYENPQKMIHHKENLDSRVCNDYFGSKTESQVKQYTEERLGNDVVEITEICDSPQVLEMN